MVSYLSPDMVILPVSKRAQAIVRAASLSADKTFFEACETDDIAVAEAVEAGYIVNLRGHQHVWRITARGEAYLEKLRGAH